MPLKRKVRYHSTVLRAAGNKQTHWGGGTWAGKKLLDGWTPPRGWARIFLSNALDITLGPERVFDVSQPLRHVKKTCLWENVPFKNATTAKKEAKMPECRKRAGKGNFGFNRLIFCILGSFFLGSFGSRFHPRSGPVLALAPWGWSIATRCFFCSPHPHECASVVHGLTFGPPTPKKCIKMVIPSFPSSADLLHAASLGPAPCVTYPTDPSRSDAFDIRYVGCIFSIREF